MEADGSREQNNHKIARFFLAPIIGLNRLFSAILKKTLGANYADVSEEEVRDLVDALAKDEDEDGIEETSAEMINKIFEFESLTAADVMTHRTSIVGVDVKSITLDDLIYLALDMGFSRIPAFEDSVDKIVGLIIVKDLLCLIGKEDLSDFKIADFLREVRFIPEACSASDIFRILTENRAGMAVVVDEYGGTAGIVTLEDIIEAIMGNIQDEYDDEQQLITKIGDKVYEVSGEANPEEVFGLFGIELPKGHEYETIAGFITDKLGYIPDDTDGSFPRNAVPPSVDYEGIKLVVMKVEDRNMRKIRAIKLPDKYFGSEKDSR